MTAHYRQEWLDKLTSHGKITYYYAVSEAEYQVIEDTITESKLNEDEGRMLKHIVACTIRRIRLGLRGDDLFIPLAAKFIATHFPKAYWMHIQNAGLIITTSYSRSKRESREFGLSPTFLKRLLDTAKSADLDELDQVVKINLMTGRPTQRRLKNVLNDDNRHEYPELYRKAILTITETGRPVNIEAMKAVVRARRTEADRLEAEKGADSAEYVTANARWATDYYCLQTVYDHSTDLGNGIRLYRPTYSPSKTGRAIENGGGLQSCSRKMKQASIEGMTDLKNVDMKSAQIRILAQLLEDNGIDATVWREYLADPRAKHTYAERANISVETWKTCLLALVFGADTHVEFKQLDEGKKNYKPALLDTIFRACDRDIDRAAVMLEDFLRVASPFIKSIRVWHRLLMKKVIFQPEICSYRRGNHYITNVGGWKLCVGDIKKGKSRKVAAFFLQGYESTFIHNLTVLGDKYGYEACGNEHDGLVVRLAEGTDFIPEMAIEEAAMAAGLTHVELEEKPFYSDEDARRISEDIDFDELVEMLLAFENDQVEAVV